MYHFVCSMLLLVFCWPLTAQITSGTIDYTESFTFELGDWLPADRKKQMEERMAAGDFNRTGRLTFSQAAFSYMQLPRAAGSRSMGWWSSNQENPDVFYTSVVDSTVTDQRQVLDRSFIVKGEWIVPEWNIANMKVGMKELPLPTQLATAVSAEGDTLTAYYTPSIPLSIGPRGYGGLPGAILYLRVVRDGRTTEYTMRTMQPMAGGVEMVPPAGAEEIDRTTFEKHQKRAREARERRIRSWRRRN